MKKNKLITTSVGASLIAFSLVTSNNVSYASNLCDNGEPPSWDGSCDHTTDDDAKVQGLCPNGLSPSWDGSCDHTSEQLQEDIQETADEEVSATESSSNDFLNTNTDTSNSFSATEDVEVAQPTYAPGMSPGEHAGWAIVDPITGQASSVIVCTPEVCGSGWFDGNRVVLQTLQDYAGATNSFNGQGGVAGYGGPEAVYNFETGEWTLYSQGAVYTIPLAYPGTDSSGKVNFPKCVLNCPVENDPFNPETWTYGDQNIVLQESLNMNSSDEQPDSFQITEKSGRVLIDNNGKINLIKIKFGKPVKSFEIIGQSLANNSSLQKKIWKIKRNKPFKTYTFKVPNYYKNWDFIVKGKKNVKNIRVFNSQHSGR